MAEQTEKNKTKKNFLSDWGLLKKIKSIKHLEVIVAVILGAIILLIYFSSSSTRTNDSVDNVEYTSLNEYTRSVEQKLQQVLSSIDGAGQVDVMISFDSGLELVIAYSTETKTTTSSTTGGGKTETTIVVQTPILVSEKGVSKPIVLKEKLPQPQSVVVVSSGADNVKVKLDLVKAVETILSLPSSKIEIFIGK